MKYIRILLEAISIKNNMNKIELNKNKNGEIN